MLPISKFFASSSGDHNHVIRAETQFTEFIIEHNLPWVVAYHATQELPLPWLWYCQEIRMWKNTTLYIIETLAMDTEKNRLLKSFVRTHSVWLTDGSTDYEYEDVKLHPICIKFCDLSTGKVKSVTFSSEECDKPLTGENIFECKNRQNNGLILIIIYWIMIKLDHPLAW